MENNDNYIDFKQETSSPARRYLLIECYIPFKFPESVDELKRNRYSTVSDSDFEILKREFESFVGEKDSSKLLSVGMFNSYANINLPKTYDIIFDIRDKKIFWEQKLVVKYAYNYGYIFHTDLWQGHSSHIIIEVIGELPPIFDRLSSNYNCKVSQRC